MNCLPPHLHTTSSTTCPYHNYIIPPPPPPPPPPAAAVQVAVCTSGTRKKSTTTTTTTTTQCKLLYAQVVPGKDHQRYSACKCPCASCMVLLHPAPTCAVLVPSPPDIQQLALVVFSVNFQQLAQALYLHLWWLYSATCAGSLFLVPLAYTATCTVWWWFSMYKGATSDDVISNYDVLHSLMLTHNWSILKASALWTRIIINVLHHPSII